MPYVPKPLNPEWTGWDIPEAGGTVPSITVYALSANKRPVGFAPWPKPRKKRKRSKHGKR